MAQHDQPPRRVARTSKPNTFFGGAAILAVGILVVKLIGMFYKIPLLNIIGEQGNADFNNAYNIYSVLLTISTAGLPVAVSKLVSEADALGRRNQVRRTFRLALALFLILGVLSFLVMFFGSEQLAGLMNDSMAAPGIRALAPAVICVGCLSAFRGYAQGHGSMTPTAVSQIIEALCKLLLEAPDLLLLDEPTNHLDAESILWLEQFLHQYKGAVIAVTHDRYFMDNVAEWICEVDRGQLYPYKGNYSTYLETKAKRLEIQGAKDAKLAKRLKNELDWVRSSPKARQAKNKARLERYDQMENEARNNKKLDFSEIQIPAGPRLGSTVLEANHIHKAFGERVLIDDLSFTLPRNGIVGVIGPNGVGKSTLFKTIVGLEPLTSGELKIGDTVKISYVDQNREGLDPNKNLWEAVSGGLDFIEVAGVEVPTRAYVASFGFKGADQQKLTGVLSGGERNRLNLALTLKQGGNLLLLDEPTNDLDVETLESLENALLEFPGCAVVISHDRWFLDRVATHILAWEGDDDNPAKWYWFEGNFQAYQENKVARLGEDAARPHRLHKKLVRG